MKKIKYVKKRFDDVTSDITSYCNARCLFCYNSWKEPSVNISDDIFHKYLKVLPFAYFYFFSCSFEPTLHPRFSELLQAIPKEHGKRVFFTTNLVKHIPDDVFETMAKSGIDHINISLETFDKDLYYKLTRTTNSNFFDNLDRMTKIFSQHKNAPKIHFITMVLRDNYSELIDIAKKVARNYHPRQHEFRVPYYCNTENLRDHLLSKNEIDEIKKKLYSLRLPSISMVSDFLDIEEYDKIRSLNIVGEPPLNVPLSVPELNMKYVANLKPYGKVFFDELSDVYDINEIDDPEKFYAEILIKLQSIEANKYLYTIGSDSPPIQTMYNSSEKLGKVYNAFIFDSRFLFLRGKAYNFHRPPLYLMAKSQNEVFFYHIKNTPKNFGSSSSLYLKTFHYLFDIAKYFRKFALRLPKRKIAVFPCHLDYYSKKSFTFECHIDLKSFAENTSIDFSIGYFIDSEFVHHEFYHLPKSAWNNIASPS